MRRHLAAFPDFFAVQNPPATAARKKGFSRIATPAVAAQT